MKKILAGTVFFLTMAFVFGQDIALPEPGTKIGTDLLDAISSRMSARNFVKHETSLADLSTILWAGNGQKKGADAVTSASKAGRTIPYSGDNAYVNVYVFTDKGAYFYDPAKNSLKQLANKDSRDAVTVENIKTASFMVLFTYDFAKAPAFLKGNPVMLKEMLNANTGYSAQNIMLAAACLKLKSVVMYNLKSKDIASVLKLGKDEIPVSIIQLGYSE
jgi:SagB-type dehydrogenase family enzyme